MNNNPDNSKWSENVILVDADYVDKVTFDLTVNFERMIGRRIPKADMALWLECIALDGGLREGNHETQVVLIHGGKRQAMENFTPGTFRDELDGKAFKGNLGEFLISALPVEEDMTTPTDLFVESLEVIANSKEAKRIMVVADTDKAYNRIRESMKHADDSKRITVFTMQPMAGGNFRQEILGYSLMQALGIRADEIK
ncbi:MAG: DUF6621 family protein [Prevotella sp.]